MFNIDLFFHFVSPVVARAVRLPAQLEQQSQRFPLEALLPWFFSLSGLVALIYLIWTVRKKLAEPIRVENIQGTPKRISLQVPENINLIEMSNEDLEAMALEMSRKIASDLPRSSTLLGVERIVLTNNPSADWEVWGEWSRGCFRPELEREGLVVNPEVFQSPIQDVSTGTQASKRVIQNKSVS
jgi:hypothetical protein